MYFLFLDFLDLFLDFKVWLFGSRLRLIFLILEGERSFLRVLIFLRERLLVFIKELLIIDILLFIGLIEFELIIWILGFIVLELRLLEFEIWLDVEFWIEELEFGRLEFGRLEFGRLEFGIWLIILE